MARRATVYREVVGTHYASLLAYAEALAGSARDGEELLADALTSTLAWPRLVRSTGSTEFAVRVALARRAARRRPSRAGRDAPADARTDAPAAFAALAGLSPAARVAVVLHHHDGLGVEEIAARMRTSSARTARLLTEGEAAAAAALGVDVGASDSGESTVVAAHGRRR